jgi:hypothetical protein
MDKSIKPNTFIVGAPKCGTTSLYTWLKQHPNVFMPENIKEPAFFCTDFHKQANINNSFDYFAAPTEKEYKELFSEAEGHDVIGEASAMYLNSETAPKNIAEFNPEAQIIIMLRDPVEQMYSSYYHSVKTGMETATSFKQALQLEPQRKQGKKLPNNRFPNTYQYTDRATFSKQIPHYQKHFPKGQIKVILLDDIKEDAEKVYTETLEFLGLDIPDEKPDLSNTNPGKVPRSMLINNAVKNPGFGIKKFVKRLLPERTRRSIKRFLNLFLVKDGNRPKLDPRLRQKLMDQHKENVKKTSELIDRDLVTKWEYDQIN